MENLLWVCVGSALGGGARYLTATFLPRAWAGEIPVATLLVNVVGSFLLAVIVELALETTWVGPHTRLFLATGVMGGFTTYSTFNYELLRGFVDGARGPALLYFLATVLGCLLAGAVGMVLARWIAR